MQILGSSGNKDEVRENDPEKSTASDSQLRAFDPKLDVSHVLLRELRSYLIFSFVIMGTLVVTHVGYSHWDTLEKFSRTYGVVFLAGILFTILARDLLALSLSGRSDFAIAREDTITNFSGSANVARTVTVEASKLSLLRAVVITIVTSSLSAIIGAYTYHQFALWRAPEVAINGTETLLGLAKGTIEIAQANQASPELLYRLETLSSQARAIQANVASLQQPEGTASLQADFWLPLGQGAKLPKEGTIGVNGVIDTGDIVISFNDNIDLRIPTGKKLSYKAKDGTECYLVYVGASPDGKLYGFKTWCSA